jgi:hypothetical protein
MLLNNFPKINFSFFFFCQFNTQFCGNRILLCLMMQNYLFGANVKTVLKGIKLNKEKETRTKPFFCPLGKFKCHDSTCIPITKRCDGRVNCPRDKADEEDCRM